MAEPPPTGTTPKELQYFLALPNNRDKRAYKRWRIQELLANPGKRRQQYPNMIRNWSSLPINQRQYTPGLAVPPAAPVAATVVPPGGGAVAPPGGGAVAPPGGSAIAPPGRGPRVAQAQARVRDDLRMDVPDDDRVQPSDDEEDAVSAYFKSLNPSGHIWAWVKTLYHIENEARTGWNPKVKSCTVSLYVLVDENDRIVDRTVVKAVHALNAESIKTGLDEEEIMNGLPDCDALVKPKHPLSGPDADLKFQLYFDYKPYGTLDDLIISYRSAALGGIGKKTGIPEPFIWLVFYQLSEALFAFSTYQCAKDLEKAGTAINKVPRSDVVLVHKDIKPQNILLDIPRAPYISYPNPQLTDFDISQNVDMTKDVEWNTVFCQGTASYLAPEMVQLIRKKWFEETYPDVVLDIELDVWNVGLIIWEMMNAGLGKEIRDELRYSAESFFHFDEGNEHAFPPGAYMTDEDPPNYSLDLTDLVRECLTKDPLKRVSHEVLRQRTGLYLEEFKNNPAEWEFGNFTDKIAKRNRLQYGDDPFGLDEEALVPRKRPRV